jgi:RimJ/RimL family protein N-acetyltransferase
VLPRLETDRLVLREWTADDAEPFAALNADPEVTRHLAGPMTRAESDAAVERIRGHWDTYGYGLHAVELKADGRFVGFIGLAHHRALPDDVEIGWRLARDVWGRGLATEGALASRDAAFGVLGLARLVSLTTDENLASRRVMDKIGLRYDRHIAFERWNLRVHLLP